MNSETWEKCIDSRFVPPLIDCYVYAIPFIFKSVDVE